MKRRNLAVAAVVLLPIMLTSFQNCAGDNQINEGDRSSSSSTTLTPNPTPNPFPQASKPCAVFLTSGSSWTVPSDWNSGNNTIEAVGNGSDASGNVRGGGGGGAYSKSVNVTLTRGTQVAYNVAHIQMQGSAGNSSGDVYLCNSTLNCNSLTSSAVVVSAQGGRGTTDGPGPQYLDMVGGAGGSAAAGIAIGPGAVKYSGGNGGSTDGGLTPGGGGGAAGPNGNGLNGTSVGGAANGGSGAAGGGRVGNGGVGLEFGPAHGVGGGGGGGNNGTTGGNGGNYGGGGGGGGYAWYQLAGIGGGGLIVIKYQGTTCQ